MHKVYLVMVLFAMTGCASIQSLPQSASRVDFNTVVEGKTGWSEYQGVISVEKIDEVTAYEAAKAGLRSAGFTVRRGDIDKLVVMGEHGMTAYDWNVVAGVYIKSDDSKTFFKAIVEGSKDIGFAGDATGADWVGEIFSGIRGYLGVRPVAGADPKGHKTAAATCFVVSPDGKILSNEHVTSDGQRIVVVLSDGRELAAKVVSQSRNTDLALLEVDADNLDYLPMSSPRSAKIGMDVFTLGYPVTSILGEEIKFTDGVISSLSGIAGEAAFMQITVPIQPGNSGGPLVNNDGEVVGIVTSTAAVGNFLETAGTLPQNINWAVKSDYALLMFDQPARPEHTSSRQGAIERSRKAACRIIVDK